MLLDELRPSQGVSHWPAFAYSASKPALNALTVGFAHELRDDGIVVRVVTPGFVATDLHAPTRALTTDEGRSA
ncbi:SDR family NAD(P)-dependent oxidoreductase [Myxococcus sp. AB056]|uniref:SDR family NAD(P)-dependent oxidoreductase n=1 Tax=Myxococcus sp. AB056 TaxID=2562792 RepID=UPI00114774A8|nr:SDR family NAD(P)-dependent oxidoreductase [Myxococcus sp. AB056]